jgi:ABC-type nickel/cobalt efflux system permease component RcnA
MTEEKPREVIVVGMSNSLKLMAFSIFLFGCMCSLFTALLINPATEASHMIIASAALGIILMISIYMIMRYFTEQSIVYNAMNMHITDEVDDKTE